MPNRNYNVTVTTSTNDWVDYATRAATTNWYKAQKLQRPSTCKHDEIKVIDLHNGHAKCVNCRAIVDLARWEANSAPREVSDA